MTTRKPTSVPQITNPSPPSAQPPRFRGWSGSDEIFVDWFADYLECRSEWDYYDGADPSGDEAHRRAREQLHATFRPYFAAHGLLRVPEEPDGTPVTGRAPRRRRRVQR